MCAAATGAHLACGRPSPPPECPHSPWPREWGKVFGNLHSAIIIIIIMDIIYIAPPQRKLCSKRFTITHSFVLNGLSTWVDPSHNCKNTLRWSVVSRRQSVGFIQSQSQSCTRSLIHLSSPLLASCIRTRKRDLKSEFYFWKFCWLHPLLFWYFYDNCLTRWLRI